MKKIISWILRIIAAAIMAQTLYFKFTGAEESVAIFTELGMEPHGRAYGAILTWGLMSGAIMGHISQIGFAGDRGQLFLLAVIVWISATILLVLFKNQIPIVRHMFEKADRVDLTHK
jgi:hypothetical protein